MNSAKEKFKISSYVLLAFIFATVFKEESKITNNSLPYSISDRLFTDSVDNNVIEGIKR